MKGTYQMQETFPAAPEALARMRAFVRHALKGASPEEVSEVVLAVSEACANAVSHASGEHVDVAIEVRSDVIDVRVADDGVFGTPQASKGGLSPGIGIPLILAIMDEVRIKRGRPESPGTTVRMFKRLHRITVRAA
jgi:anti-sigma regulatory factor (Ser/Thr protein kinase)